VPPSGFNHCTKPGSDKRTHVASLCKAFEYSRHRHTLFAYHGCIRYKFAGSAARIHIGPRSLLLVPRGTFHSARRALWQRCAKAARPVCIGWQRACRRQDAFCSRISNHILVKHQAFLRHLTQNPFPSVQWQALTTAGPPIQITLNIPGRQSIVGAAAKIPWLALLSNTQAYSGEPAAAP
jgi:hypothetical protein